MFYVDLNTGKLKTKLELLRDFSNVSTPEKWGANTLATFNVAEVENTSAPAFDAYTKAIPDSAEEYEKGKWRVVHRAEPMFQEYKDDNGVTVTVEEQIAEYEANNLKRRREGMTVSNKALRLALNDMGVYGDVEGAMAKSTNTTELEIHWNFSTTVNRLDSWVVEVGGALDMDDDQLDALFDAAGGGNK